MCRRSSAIADTCVVGPRCFFFSEKGLFLPERAAFKETKKQHLAEARREREDYYLNKALSARRGDNCMCMIADGIDQAKMCVPCLPRYPKKLDLRYCLRLGMMGIKMVSTQRYDLLYLHTNRFQRNANNPINAIIQSIADLFRERRKEGRPTPKTCFLQFDNCVSENKSMAMYGLAAMLVGLGVFDELRINYLLVGHTHEDIDQMFSTVSKMLSKSTAWTPGDMYDLLSGCSLGKDENDAPRKPKVTVVPQQVDYVSWIRHVLPDMAGVTTPHVLRFIRDSDSGDVLLSSKLLSTDKTWQEHGVLLTEANLKTLVATRPAYVPLKPLDCDKLLSMLDACAEDGLLPEGVQEAWKEFLAYEESLTEDTCSTCLYAMLLLVLLCPTMRFPYPTPSLPPNRPYMLRPAPSHTVDGTCRDLRAQIASTTIVQRDKDGDPAARRAKAAKNAALRKELRRHANDALSSSAHPRVTDWVLPDIAPAFTSWGWPGGLGSPVSSSGSGSGGEAESESQNVQLDGSSRSSSDSESSEPPTDVVVGKLPERIAIGGKRVPKKRADARVVVGKFVAMFNNNAKPYGTPNGVWLGMVKEEPKDVDGELMVLVDWFVHTAKDKALLSGTWARESPRHRDLVSMRGCVHAGFLLTTCKTMHKKDQTIIAEHPLMVKFASPE